MGTQIAKAVVDGILTGGVYALMAAGLTLIFGVMQIINIAQGIFVVLGCVLELRAAGALRIDPFIGLRDHDAVDVHHRCRHRVGIHPAAEAAEPQCAVDPGHLRGRNRHRRESSPSSSPLTCKTSTPGTSRSHCTCSASTCPTSTLIGFALARGPAGRPVRLPLSHAGRPEHPGIRAEPDGRGADRHQHQPGLGHHLRHRRRRSPRPAGWCSARPTPSTPTPATT